MDFEIRELRTVAQGRSKLVREREEYFRLMSAGMSSQEACRVAGINYQTGKRVAERTDALEEDARPFRTRQPLRLHEFNLSN
ncbi:hypothetical protein ACFY1C_29940 [Streptomyces sp. NPDC001279]|uniref:hypothetical protein n=1 Tax=Streptomyces sp. NPDC001279 TaxID=3364556 RepID=UPI0036BA26A3